MLLIFMLHKNNKSTGGIEMNDESRTALHWSFWLIGGLCLVWYLLGVMAYFQEMNPESLAAMPDAHRMLVEQRPAWATGAFAVAVFGGALGCVLLLLRKWFALRVFVVSLVGVVVQMVYNLAIAESTVGYGPGEIAMIVMIPAFGVFLIWYTRSSKDKGWVS